MSEVIGRTGARSGVVGRMGGSMQLVRKISPSGASTAQFSEFTDKYENYIFILNNLLPAADTTLYVRALLDGTEKTTGYITTSLYSYTNSSSDNGESNVDSTTHFAVADPVGLDVVQGGVNAFLTLSSPTSQGIPHRLYGNMTWVNASTYIYNGTISSHDNNVSEAITGMKFWFHGQNFSGGSIAMYGVNDG